MKTAFSLLMKETDLHKILKKVKYAGFQGIEPTFHVEGLPSPERFTQDAERLKKACSEYNLEIPSMRGGPLFWNIFASDDEKERSQALQLVEKALSALKIMGGDTLLVVPGKWHRGQSYFSLYRNALETAKDIGEIAADMDMTVGLENVENNFLLSPREWSQFIDEVNSPAVKIYFDPGNIYYLGLGEASDWIKDLGNRICRIHLKDCLVRAEGFSVTRTVTDMGEGIIDWNSVNSSLKDIRYKNWLSVEIPMPEKGRQEFLRRNYSFVSKVFL